MISIGFTGTQHGLTNIQIEMLRDMLAKMGGNELHHGDCYGGDESAHKIADDLGYSVVIHPPLNESKRAFCESEYILDPAEYLERNHTIVNACDILIACPKERTEQLRSGTWSTICYAIKKGKVVNIIMPDGELVQKV